MVCMTQGAPLVDRSPVGVTDPGNPTEGTMKRFWILAASLAVLSQAGPLHAETQTWFGFQVGISGGNAPPPVVFRSEPRTVYVNDVYVVDDDRCDDDMFRSDNMWWRLRGGYWYRARSWGGPWIAVDVRRVPERVLVVPANHWKHHPHGGPPGLMRREGYYDRHGDRDDNRGRHRGRGHGHGHGDDD